MLSAKWRPSCLGLNVLTHWSRVTHICVSKLASIGLDNGLSPSRRQAIIWTNGGILLIRNLGTNFSEIIIGIQAFSFKKIRSKMSSEKLRPFCVGLNEFRSIPGCLPVVRSDKKWWWKTCTISAGNICITYGYGRWVQSPICHDVSFTDCKGKIRGLFRYKGRLSLYLTFHYKELYNVNSYTGIRCLYRDAGLRILQCNVYPLSCPGPRGCVRF